LLISEALRLLELGEYKKAKRAADQAMEKVAMVENRAGLVLDRYSRPDLIEKWRRWVKETIEWSRQNETYAIVVDKSRHTCTVYNRGQARKSYPVNLGVNGFNQKYRAGDLATPEGRYEVIRKQDMGESRYHKGLMLNYPNEEDWQRFQQAKQDRYISTAASIGGLIMLHGDGRKNVDWTQGCVALENKHMDEIYEWAEVGTPVTIVGRDATRNGAEVAQHPDVVAKTKAKLAKRNGQQIF
jgi:murein L,D-transpeptidase YafK